MKSLMMVALLATAAVAGCLDEEPTVDEGPEPAMEPEMVRGSGNATIDAGWAVGIGTPITPGMVQFLTTNGGSFDLPKGAQAEITAEWSCAVPACDMELRIFEGGSLYDAVQGGSPLTVSLQNVTTTDWAAGLTDVGLGVNVEATISVAYTWVEEVHAHDEMEEGHDHEHGDEPEDEDEPEDDDA